MGTAWGVVADATDASAALGGVADVGFWPPTTCKSLATGRVIFVSAAVRFTTDCRTALASGELSTCFAG